MENMLLVMIMLLVNVKGVMMMKVLIQFTVEIMLLLTNMVNLYKRLLCRTYCCTSYKEHDAFSVNHSTVYLGDHYGLSWCSCWLLSWSLCFVLFYIMQRSLLSLITQKNRYVFVCKKKEAGNGSDVTSLRLYKTNTQTTNRTGKLNQCTGDIKVPRQQQRTGIWISLARLLYYSEVHLLST